MRSRRFPSSLAIVSLLTGLGALLTACDSGPSGPTHFSILSPGESRVTVLPGESVHFQVQLNSTGFRVEYAVDGETVHEGPTFDFTPVLVEHTVRVSVLPVASTAAPDVQEFTVGVAVPGNTPPAVSSFGHVPEIAEALQLGWISFDHAALLARLCVPRVEAVMVELQQRFIELALVERFD